MKISKSLFLAFAGLGLFACSNEDVTENGVQGGADVTVTVNPQGLSRGSRAIDPSNPINGVNGDEQDVDINSIVVKLTAGVGSNEQKFTSMSELTNGTVTFNGVRNPSKIEVFINGGKAEDWTLAEFYQGNHVGLAAPMYGSADGNEFETTTSAEGKTVYNVTVTPKHETALLEFSGISHKDDGEGCIFNAINFEGLFLNHVKLAENGQYMGDDNLTKVESFYDVQQLGYLIPTYSVIADADMNFLTHLKVWPAEGKCYSYNIFPQASLDLPVLTLCFKDIAVKDGQVWANADNKGYATVKTYKLSSTEELTEQHLEEMGATKTDPVIKKFAAGYVYKFTGLEVADENIGTTIEGGEDASLVATIKVIPWTIAEGTVEWN